MCTDVPTPGNTWHHFTLGVATHLKTVVLRTPVNEWLGPMKEAPSNEGTFLVSVKAVRQFTHSCLILPLTRI